MRMLQDRSPERETPNDARVEDGTPSNRGQDARDTTVGDSAVPIEMFFDVARPSGAIEFLGLAEGLDNSGHEMSGLFSWTCQACHAVNRDVIIVQPQRAFLTKWSCKQCSQAVLVRFGARAAAEWTAQHALTIMGKMPGQSAGESGPCAAGRPQRAGSPGQRIFAWLTIPALAAIILLGVKDLTHLRSSSAAGREGRHWPANSYAWLGGYWVDEHSNDVLYFGYINPAAHCGTYTRVRRENTPACIVRFEIVHEDATDERLVLKEMDGPPPRAAALHEGPGPSDTSNSNALLYLSRSGPAMVRMTTDQGQPVVTAYRHFAKSPLHEGPANAD
jgi:hypothetical protein